MPFRPSKPCGCTQSKRCPSHEQQRNARRSWYQGPWPAISRRTIKEWVATHGWTCPGYDRPPHPSQDLTTDHVEGRNPQVLGVLCRECNGRKGGGGVQSRTGAVNGYVGSPGTELEFAL